MCSGSTVRVCRLLCSVLSRWVVMVCVYVGSVTIAAVFFVSAIVLWIVWCVGSRNAFSASASNCGLVMVGNWIVIFSVLCLMVMMVSLI